MDARRFWERIKAPRTLLVAMATIPFVASLGFQSVTRAPRARVDTVARPALVFDQYFVNLSDIHDKGRVDAYYHFKNCGKSPVRITRIEPSCGCLNPRLEKRSYLPGEECDFSIGILTTHEKPGPHEFELKIDYQDPEPRSVTVSFKIVVRREVVVQPSHLLLYTSGKEEHKQTVTITDMRPTPFHVTGATCKSPLVKAQVGPAVDDPDGGRETTVIITVAAVAPEKGEKTAVYLTTDDPRYPRIPIPVWIYDVRTHDIKPLPGTRIRVTRPTAP